MSETEQNEKNGEKLFERIRLLIREKRIEGIRPAYIILTLTEMEDLIDYLMREDKMSPISDQGIIRVMGLEIITDEKCILRLNNN
jgi:hypothetical protein